MKLENEFTVPASIDEAWALMLDVPRVAPCLPGAKIDEGTDGEYKGTMTIKIGPITARYSGTVKIQDSDEAAHRVAMRAQAKDARGQGTAAATITSTMEETPEGTKVHVVTDMRVTGPAAQFGRGVMQDVSAKMMGRFADCLAEEMRSGGKAEPEADAAPSEAAPVQAAGGDTPSATTDTSPTGVPGASSGEPTAEAEKEIPKASSGTSSASSERRAPEVLDLGEASREAVLKRAIPLVAGVVGLLVLLRLIRR